MIYFQPLLFHFTDFQPKTSTDQLSEKKQKIKHSEFTQNATTSHDLDSERNNLSLENDGERDSLNIDKGKKILEKTFRNKLFTSER